MSAAVPGHPRIPVLLDAIMSLPVVVELVLAEPPVPPGFLFVKSSVALAEHPIIHPNAPKIASPATAFVQPICRIAVYRSRS
jgi:hypothetical protein